MNIHLLPGLDPARLATLLSSRNPALALRERDYAVQADQSDAYINSMRAMAEAARLDAELAQLTALAAGDPLPGRPPADLSSGSHGSITLRRLHHVISCS